MFPYKVQNKNLEENWLTKRSYFNSDLSFYSKEHGGTFHFMQFNVLEYSEFLNSEEFKHFLKFICKSFPELKEHT